MVILARCVDSQSDFLAASWDEMKGKVAKRHFIYLDFQKTFRRRDVFCTLRLLLVRLGFCWLLLCWLFIRSFAVCPANTVFDTCVSFTFFSNTLYPLATKQDSKQVNNTNFGFLIGWPTYMLLPWNVNKYKQALKIGFVYLQKIWLLGFLYTSRRMAGHHYLFMSTEAAKFECECN